MSLLLSPPHPLVATHVINEFDCGEVNLDDWLKHRALINQVSGAVRRNMPDPIPVLILARLAGNHRAQGIKLGASLLQDAVNRAESVAQNAGVEPW